MLRDTLLEKLRLSRSFGDLASLRPRPKSSLEVYVSVLRPLDPNLTVCAPPTPYLGTEWGCSVFLCWCGPLALVLFCELQNAICGSLHVYAQAFLVVVFLELTYFDSILVDRIWS